jgi:hypothetical protein
MLSGNWVARPFGTFFKHASAFDKVLGGGHWHLLAESPIGSNRCQGFVPGLKRFTRACRACAGGFDHSRKSKPAGSRRRGVLASPVIATRQAIDGDNKAGPLEHFN